MENEGPETGTLEQRYLSYYLPLVSALAEKIRSIDSFSGKAVPEPFFPCFGRSDEAAKTRIMVIGRDKRRWGGMNDFLTQEHCAPTSVLKERLKKDPTGSQIPAVLHLNRRGNGTAVTNFGSRERKSPPKADDGPDQY